MFLDMVSLWPVTFFSGSVCGGTITLFNKMSFSGTSLYSHPPERCKGTSREAITISRLSQEKKNPLPVCTSNIPLCFIPMPCKKIIKTAYASQQNLEIPGLFQLDIRGLTRPPKSAHKPTQHMRSKADKS